MRKALRLLLRVSSDRHALLPYGKATLQSYCRGGCGEPPQKQTYHSRTVSPDIVYKRYDNGYMGLLERTCRLFLDCDIKKKPLESSDSLGFLLFRMMSLVVPKQTNGVAHMLRSRRTIAFNRLPKVKLTVSKRELLN